MSQAQEAVAIALREAGERTSAVVREFFEQVAVKRIEPVMGGYTVYEHRRDGLPPETVRLKGGEFVTYDGEAAALRSGFVAGLPFFVYDGRLQRGPYPPPSVVGEAAAVAAVHQASDLLSRFIGHYLETGQPATSI